MAFFGNKWKALVRGQRSTLDKEHKAQLESLHGAVWFHAASVGEFEQARPLIEKLRNERPKQKIVVTFFSPSGYEARKNYDLADAVLYLPFATRLKARRFIDALQPKMAIFVKYEFWPAYIRQLHKRAIPTYSICSIFRTEQIFFRPWGGGQRRLLKLFTHLYVQDEASRRLLAEHGIHQATVVGDTRFDRVKQVQSVPTTKDVSPIELFVAGTERVIIAGSTWPKDEQLLAQYMSLQSSNVSSQTKLILVPHEIDEAHLHFIFNLFQGRMVKYSAVSSQHSEDSIRNILRQANVLVIDTMGLLSTIYRFGQVAYIGGGFGVGIHNTIEAAVYGVPVLFGPHYQHFREAKGLIEAGAARSIKNYSELEAALETALADHEAIGTKAAQYVESELEATDRIYNAIFEI